MNVKMLAVAAAIAASTVATGAAAQSVTPEQVLKLPVGTTYADNGGAGTFVRTAKGFNFFVNPASKDPANIVECNSVTKAGGHGNATINCTAKNKVELRFEWINLNSIRVDGWKNLAAKAGPTQYQPAQVRTTFTRK